MALVEVALLSAQGKMVGGMGVRKNVHIENWASFRENCEYAFKFSRANWARIAVFGVAVPICAYKLIVYEFVRCSSVPMHFHC